MNDVLKWVATVILIIGTLINSLGYYPAGPIILLAGGLIWLVVAIRWREWSLIVTNGVMFLMGIGGLIYTYFK
jgi:hypothetical protein